MLEQFGEGIDVSVLCAQLRERCCYPVGVQAILFVCGVRQHRGSQESGQGV